MRRGLWFAAGAGAGLYAAIRGRRAAEAFTPDGLRDRWQALGLGARLFREEVAVGKADAEVRLRERFAPSPDSTPQLTSGLDTPSLVPHDGGSTHERKDGKQ
ncbi:DUF6167 family protein [Nocardioides sp. BP30]|uniref:DUF6167 family protein n=1 Tax=Nocardioides sp. BP30 TaxID=3036374 RepID=UPI0024697459|nr:DUF6167 family protein [Nocardioides sp. BP30]WGL50431.1 DUF6167 family protein [Nocardioides sp. BP30]